MTADKIKKNKLGGTGGTHGRTEKYVYCLVENNRKKSLLGRPKRRFEEIIFVFKEINLGRVVVDK
jgi:hypothetical protein